MATGERRLGSSARRGMTVLGKIPVVPKPINLPSQRLENRGLDPSVEIVPRGTFSWGTGRSPPASSSSWGNVGLSSSPPTNTGAWNMTSISTKPISNTDNVTGGVAQNPPRPLSAGSTRPSSAGTTRPSSASATSGRAWAGAPKLDEQIQPSPFSLATVDFPTLGSEKNPNLRPLQNTAPSNRPTSADATKERIPAHAGTSLNRPTSADGSKERKIVYPGLAPADRPTSADGSFVDKGRHHSDIRLPTLPPFVDGNLADQRHSLYTGVAEHGTGGPGPGTHVQFKDNPNLYPPLVQHSMALAGSHMLHVGDIMQPGALQHDRHFNGPLHSNIEREVLVLPVDTRPGVYNSYPMDLGPNHFDRSRVHHSQSRWGPNHLDRPGVYQSYHPPAILHIEPQLYGREAVMQHHQGNRRDGSNAAIKHFGEQRAGWDGRNVVLIGSSTDTRESSVPTPGSGREPQNRDVFTASWGHEPKHSGWGDSHRGETSMGTCRVGPSAAMVEQTALPSGGPEDMHREGKGAGRTGEMVHSVSSRGSDAGKFGANSSVVPLGASLAGMASEIPNKEVTEISSSLRPSVQFHKQEDSAKNLMANTRNSGSEVLQGRNETWINGSSSGSSASAGTQPLKMKQEDERNRAEQSKEPQRVGFVSNMAKPRQEVNWHDNFESKSSTHVVDTDSQNGPPETVKNINAKKEMFISQRSTKGNRKDDSFPSQLPPSEEPHRASKMISSKFSKVNGRTSSSAVLSASSGKKDLKTEVSSGVQVSSDATKEASANAGSSAAPGAVHARIPPRTQSEDVSVGECKAIPTADSSFVAPVAEIPSLEEEGQALIDDSNMKARRNTHPSRRAQHGRSIHESHLVDKQNVNHGMVWAPVRTPIIGTTNQANTEKAGIYQEPTQHTSTEIHREKPMQPLQKHQPSESWGQRHVPQVQQTQSAAGSKQAQGQQGQEHTALSNKKQVQQGHHHKVETSSKQQGQRMQPQQSRTSDHNESEKWMQQEQSTASSNKYQLLERKQSVSSTYHEQEQPQSQFATSCQREMNKNKIFPAKEQQDKAAESRSTPIVDKLNGKKGKSENAVYVPRPARNQHCQGWEQEHGQRFAASSQRFHSKDESSVVEDQENQPSEPATVFVADSSERTTAPVANSNKNNEEVKSHNSRFSKHQKKYQHEPSASLNAGERHASTWKIPLPEEIGVNSSESSSVAEPEVNEESKIGHLKPVRHQEMQNKQSAANSHQDYIHIAGENKRRPMETPDSTSCESGTIKSEIKLYVPKHRKEKTHQQVSATTGSGGLNGQERTLEEAQSLSIEKDQHNAQSPRLSGVGSNTKKDGIELYTPKPARQSNMQGHQPRGNRRQKVGDLVEGQAVRGSSSPVASPLNKDMEIASHEGVPHLMENMDNWQSFGAGNRGDNRLHTPYESSQGKKEAKLYAARPARQHQQPVANADPVHAEVLNREERPLLERAHHMPGTEPSKRKEEMKRYTPRPARQPVPAQSPAVLEAKPVKEIENVSSLQDQEQQKSESEGRANEFEHGYKNKNHPSRPRKSAHSLSRPQMKSQSPLEDGAANDHTARVDEASEAVTYKEATKDRESGFYQKRGSRPRNHDVAENPTSEETEIVRPRQYPKQPHYQYQPVTQHPQTGKPREEESNTVYDQKFNNRQQDHGQNRYREGPPRRGRPHGYNYRAAEYAG